jgi:imidazolonepropionase-like amidohydrolase
MMRRLRSIVCLVFCVGMRVLAQNTVPIAITDVNLVDVVKGEIQSHQTVLITNGRIAGLGSADTVKVPASAVRVAGDGRYLIPGLWDMHVHFRSDQKNPDLRLVEENAALLDLFLPNGVTGVREMGGDLSDHVLRWRDEIRSGQRTGPRILTAGRKIDREPPAWAGSLGVKTPAEAREAVRQVKQSGADFIKVYGAVSREVLDALVDEAHKLHLKLTGHQPAGISIQEFVESGMDGIEHSQYLAAASREDYERFARERDRRRGTDWAMDEGEQRARAVALQDEQEGERLYKSMAEKQFWVTPTLNVYAQDLDYGVRDFSTDLRRQLIFPAIWNTWDPKLGFRRPLEARPRQLMEIQFKRWQAATVAAHKAGVPMLLGTDCGANNIHMFPGYSIHDELEALVKAGLTPADVLRMATINAAHWRGEDGSEGSIGRGKVADLVILRSNPLEAIRHTREIESVITAGKYYSRADLDAMLRRAEERASSAWRQNEHR